MNAKGWVKSGGREAARINDVKHYFKSFGYILGGVV
jgi:hypothetical protein